ncbi:hypothetical protein N9966_00100 [bacterium]|nr:hypothetical protein [bacterium]
MSVTGQTNNKLFKVRSIDVTEPYKVGQNGITNIVTENNNISKITYVLDDIIYTTSIQSTELSGIDNSFETLEPPRNVGEIVLNKKLTTKLNEAVSVVKKTKISKTLNFEKLSVDNLTKVEKIPKTIKVSQILDGVDKPVPVPVEKTTSLVTDTTFITDKFSYENFIEKKIYKNDKYVGLISKPNVTSDVFMERDVNSLFEKHQRLSEINNLSELISYKNGYFNVVNTF